MSITTDTIYLTGSVGPAILEHAERETLGLLVQPDTYKYLKHRPAFGTWAVDNGCFAKGAEFDAERWFAGVRELDGSPLFVVAPDVVGDAVATAERSAPWLGRIRELGHRAAFVAQDGCEELNELGVGWSSFDCLFIGGSTEWKLSAHAAKLIREANRRGKWTHVGRVNSARRFRWCREHGARSADGTFLAFGPTVNVPRLLSWLDEGSGL